MFKRNGQALGSVQVDPSVSDPHHRRKAAKKAAPAEPDPKPEPDPQPEPEPDPTPEPDPEPEPDSKPAAKKAPAKKATGGFKSALDKKG